jgi:predicted Zn finger-like uncharacterized protein
LRKAAHKGTFKTRVRRDRYPAAAAHGKEPMKITCQACQAKYTIADEKIQGKIAKIRCRKCGATVLVDASSGSSAKPEATVAPGAADSWLVSVAEGDQRTMAQRDVVQAYASNVITGDTYVWKDGMTDWQPLADVPELMTAIHAATPVAISPSGPPEPELAPAAAAALVPVAARRDPGRAGADLFAGGPAEDEVATSAPSHMLARGGAAVTGAASNEMASASQGGGLTGARDEHSVLFSLSALTGGPKNAAPTAGSAVVAPPPGRNEDSGLIDLNALAQAQRARMSQAAESAAPTPAAFVFPAALGTVEVPRESTPRSRMPMFVGGGIALAGIVAAVVILAGGRKEEAPTTPGMGAVSATASAEPPAPIAATAAPSTSSSADTAAADSAAAAAARSTRRAPSPVRTTPRPGPAAVAPPVAPAAPALPPPKKSPCGCATGDLQCQIRCSAMGH